MFTIHQLNNRENTSPEDISLISSLFEVVAGSFKGPMATKDFVNAELYRFLNPEKGTQLFYLTNEDKGGELVSLFLLFARDGNLPGYKNIGVSIVSTNPIYRKQGWVSFLLNWAINYYETGSIAINEVGKNISLASSLTDGTSQRYIDSEIPFHIRESGKVTWTLYSLVASFYSRFGFHADPLNSWLTISAKDSMKELQPFKLDATTETPVSIQEMDKYFIGNVFKDTADTENTQSFSCSFVNSTARESCQILVDYYKQNNGVVKSALELSLYFEENTGISIRDTKTHEETVVIMTPFFVPTLLMISKVFTSAKSEKKFIEHWTRALQYVYTYANKMWASIPQSEDRDPSDFGIFFISSDFVCKTGAVTRDRLQEIVSAQRGWKNDQPHLLPMIRVWGHPERPAHIAHNGMWCMM